MPSTTTPGRTPGPRRSIWRARRSTASWRMKTGWSPASPPLVRPISRSSSSRAGPSPADNTVRPLTGITSSATPVARPRSRPGRSSGRVRYSLGERVSELLRYRNNINGCICKGSTVSCSCFLNERYIINEQYRVHKIASLFTLPGWTSSSNGPGSMYAACCGTPWGISACLYDFWEPGQLPYSSIRPHLGPHPCISLCTVPPLPAERLPTLSWISHVIYTQVRRALVDVSASWYGGCGSACDGRRVAQGCAV